MTTTFTDIHVHQRTTGHRCLHCGEPATITAVRTSGKHLLPMSYCVEHAQHRGAINTALPTITEPAVICDDQLTLQTGPPEFDEETP